ncbi:hypothetical protein CANCADRAFT_116805 [Tortispora caseinolytica NRRL Y-17796]|uniref:Stress response protein NST1 n=1 Tax=Tortispora caseinolytica NRRL Y-17796 TaxID=767744 RepID=A0A1E4THE6_9ASCO|nr:hypothetical protein CANCADRAFT_116805 [Tortispora caseinolytica NRRL Y-17796]
MDRHWPRPDSQTPMPAKSANGAGAATATGKKKKKRSGRKQEITTKDDSIWDTSSHEEQERIREFWLGLSEAERKDLVQIDKETFKEQLSMEHTNLCPCSVCGRRRSLMQGSLGSIYDSFYDEIFPPAADRHPTTATDVSHKRINPLRADADANDDADADAEASGSGSVSPPDGFDDFTSALTMTDGVLTIADDLLQNKGLKLIEMVDQISSRRAYRQEQYADDDYYYDDDEWALDEEELDDDLAYDDDYLDTDSPADTISSEEARRMFYIFVARILEQRVLAAYRKKVTAERQAKLLQELEDENKEQAERAAKRARERERKKEKKRLQQQLAKEEERLRQEAEAAEKAKLEAQEAEERALQEQKCKQKEAEAAAAKALAAQKEEEKKAREEKLLREREQNNGDKKASENKSRREREHKEREEILRKQQQQQLEEKHRKEREQALRELQRKHEEKQQKETEATLNQVEDDKQWRKVENHSRKSEKESTRNNADGVLKVEEDGGRENAIQAPQGSNRSQLKPPLNPDDPIGMRRRVSDRDTQRDYNQSQIIHNERSHTRDAKDAVRPSSVPFQVQKGPPNHISGSLTNSPNLSTITMSGDALFPGKPGISARISSHSEKHRAFIDADPLAGPLSDSNAHTKNLFMRREGRSRAADPYTNPISNLTDSMNRNTSAHIYDNFHTQGTPPGLYHSSETTPPPGLGFVRANSGEPLLQAGNKVHGHEMTRPITPSGSAFRDIFAHNSKAIPHAPQAPQAPHLAAPVQFAPSHNLNTSLPLDNGGSLSDETRIESARIALQRTSLLDTDGLNNRPLSHAGPQPFGRGAVSAGGLGGIGLPSRRAGSPWSTGPLTGSSLSGLDVGSGTKPVSDFSGLNARMGGSIWGFNAGAMTSAAEKHPRQGSWANSQSMSDVPSTSRIGGPSSWRPPAALEQAQGIDFDSAVKSIFPVDGASLSTSATVDQEKARQSRIRQAVVSRYAMLGGNNQLTGGYANWPKLAQGVEASLRRTGLNTTAEEVLQVCIDSSLDDDEFRFDFQRDPVSKQLSVSCVPRN